MEIKSVDIVYFTGTGGTARVAKAIATKFRKNNILTSISEIKNKMHKHYDGDLLVIIFPVYAFNAAKPVDDWLRCLPITIGKRAAVISVSGGGEIIPNTACRLTTIRKLSKNGYDVCYETMFVMPSNFAVEYPIELSALLLKLVPHKANRVVKELIEGKRVHMKPAHIDYVFQKFGLLEKWFAGRIFGKHLHINENCNQCGWCMRNCPRNNINWKGEKPSFGGECVVCLRCVYGCPQNAIEPGLLRFVVLGDGYHLSTIENIQIHKKDLANVMKMTRGILLFGVRKYMIEELNQMHHRTDKFMKE